MGNSCRRAFVGGLTGGDGNEARDGELVVVLPGFEKPGHSPGIVSRGVGDSSRASAPAARLCGAGLGHNSARRDWEDA